MACAIRAPCSCARSLEVRCATHGRVPTCAAPIHGSEVESHSWAVYVSSTATAKLCVIRCDGAVSNTCVAGFGAKENDFV